MPHSHDHAPSGDNCVALSEHVCIRPTIHGGDPSIHASVTDPSPAGGPVEHLAGFIIAHDELSHPDYLTRHEGALSAHVRVRLPRLGQERQVGAGVSELYKPDYLGPWTDLGSDVAITGIRPPSEGRDYPHLYWVHKRPDGTNDGVGHIRLSAGHHTVIREDPISIGGSLLCLGCKRHGFITDGRWVEA